MASGMAGFGSSSKQKEQSTSEDGSNLADKLMAPGISRTLTRSHCRFLDAD